MIILERMYASLLRERGYGALAAAVRRERDAAWWEVARGTSAQKRKREADDLVHARPGGQPPVDDIYVRIWGVRWRDEFAAHVAKYSKLEGQHIFVVRACRSLGLPMPPASYTFQPASSTDKPAHQEDPHVISGGSN